MACCLAFSWLTGCLLQPPQLLNAKQQAIFMESAQNDLDNLRNIPTDMENDPQADEQVIDQTGGNTISVSETAEETTPEDDLANALAYALDGSGTGMAGAPPAIPTMSDPQEPTGAGPDDEATDLTERLD